MRLVRESGIATLLVDKSVAEVDGAWRTASMILVKGQIVFEGTPDALKADPELMHRHLGV